MKLPNTIDAYLKTRAAVGPWRLEGDDGTGFAGAVVIPALAESDHLPATLRSLADGPPELLARWLVVVVVNHRPDAPAADRADNAATLIRLPVWARELAPLRLAWVDAASPGRELPPKGGGVGLARKLGLDLSLERLRYGEASPVLVCLDADTVVEPAYLTAIDRHFRGATAGGAIIPFRHRPGATAAEQDAIDRYELFLRGYVLGLQRAGSPYGFHTVGSAMACTASAYVRMGGMNRRAAGEDFYFLQQLHRTSGVATVEGTTVHPAPRPSHRVPFGTGRAVGAMLAGDGGIGFYRPECFDILGRWLRLAAGQSFGSGDELLAGAAGISPELGDYLAGADLSGTWDRLRRHSRDAGALAAAFHGWFDGLKTMKLVHHLSAGPFPRCGPEEALPPLLAQAGLPVAGGPRDWLELLRAAQGAGACRSAP